MNGKIVWVVPLYSPPPALNKCFILMNKRYTENKNEKQE